MGTAIKCCWKPEGNTQLMGPKQKLKDDGTTEFRKKLPGLT
jgi:hypothetical protein